jgi:hypothetical protein
MATAQQLQAKTVDNLLNILYQEFEAQSNKGLFGVKFDKLFPNVVLTALKAQGYNVVVKDNSTIISWDFDM